MSKKTGMIHYGSPETSHKLRAALALLQDQKSTGLELCRITGRTSPNTIVSELREWCKQTGQSFTVSPAHFERTTETGAKIYSYEIIPRSTPAPIALPSGELAMNF